MVSIPTLHRGQRFRMNGLSWRVLYVNASRAHCLATVREPVTLRDTRTGLLRRFDATRRITIDIAPTSAVEMVAELEQMRCR